VRHESASVGSDDSARAGVYPALVSASCHTGPASATVLVTAICGDAYVTNESE
jgi:hypothetical protein